MRSLHLARFEKLTVRESLGGLMLSVNVQVGSQLYLVCVVPW